MGRRSAKSQGETKGRKTSQQRAKRPRRATDQEKEMEAGFQEQEEISEPKVAGETVPEKPKKPKKTAREGRKLKGARMRVVWGVFSSSVQCVQTFPYAQKKDAEALAAKLTAEKKALYFVQPVREVMSEVSEEAQGHSSQ